MTIRIGNAPCSWGVEFADDPRNPAWRTVLQECKQAGFDGIELGPVGFVPEDPVELGEALSEYELELIGGVVFRPFHDVNAWDDVMAIAEPLGGAHRNYDQIAETLKQNLLDTLENLESIGIDRLLEHRYQKLMAFGQFREA